MPDVSHPPELVAQETGAWCFAAAEQMARAYYGLEERSQYEIARGFTSARAVIDSGLQMEWQTAVLLDSTAEPPEREEGGTNLSSAVVQLVRSQYGVFDQDATGGTFVSNLTEELVRREIDADRILVIGNSIHYYVVIGYEGAGKSFVMRVLDPWPPGVGGQATTVGIGSYEEWSNRIAIKFSN